MTRRIKRPQPPAAGPYFPAADWLWQPIPAAPVLDPSSAAWAQLLATGQHGVALRDYAVTLRQATTPRYDVQFAQQGAWGADPFPTTMPFPDGTPIPPGTDGHVSVADPTARLVFSTWQTHKLTGGMAASWGGLADLDGDGIERSGSSTATKISRYAAVIRETEIAAGVIPHALFFSSSHAGPGYRFPAQKSDGIATIPEGARVQLDPSVDVSGLPKGQRSIARALQVYGAYLGDKGGASMGFICELAAAGSTTYADAGLSWDFYDLRGIPWQRLRVLRRWDGT